jgi:nicotinate phosphoribosyltransferase
MEHTAEWKIKLFLFEHDNGSTAQVVLDTGVTTLRGEGHAGQYPDGRAVPEIDTELAAGRALIDLGNRLTQIGTADAADAAVKAAVRAIG